MFWTFKAFEISRRMNLDPNMTLVVLVAEEAAAAGAMSQYNNLRLR